MIVISDGSRDQRVARPRRGRAGDLERVVDHDPPGPQALPRLVELGREDLVLVEMARLDRQVGRLERSAALLVDDVERADQPDVVAEVGDVAWPSAAVEVADERRPADGAEDEVGPTEHDVPLRVPRVQPELPGRQGDERLDLPRLQPDGPRRPVDRGARPANASSARSPSTCIPISDRIRSDAAWIDSTWSADRISTGRYGLTSRRHGSWRTPRRVAPPSTADGRPVACRAHGRDATTGRPASNLRAVSASAASMHVDRAGANPRTGGERNHATQDPGARRVGSGGHRRGRGQRRRRGVGARPRPNEYLTTEATIGDVTDEVAATGTLAAATSYGLAFGQAPSSSISGDDEHRRPSGPGRSATSKPRGDIVTAGQVLATADTTDDPPRPRATTADLKTANLQRIARSSSPTPGTPRTLNAVRQALLQVYAAQNQASKANEERGPSGPHAASRASRSPIDGIVTEVNVGRLRCARRGGDRRRIRLDDRHDRRRRERPRRRRGRPGGDRDR